MDFHGNINLKQNKMQRMVVQSESNFPNIPLVGRVVFKDQKLYMCVAINNTIPVWLPLTNKIDTFIHTEAIADTTWTVTHNLNTTAPILQIYNAAGEMLIPDSVTPLNNNEMNVTFNTAIAGTAIVLFGDLMPASGVGLLEPVTPVWSPDVSLFTYDSKFKYVGNEELTPRDFKFKTGGTSFILLGTSQIYRYDMNTEYDIENATYSGISAYIPDIYPGVLQMHGIVFSPGGNTMISYGVAGGFTRLVESSLSTAWDITSMSHAGALNANQENGPRGLTVNADGTKLFTIGDGTRKVHVYSLPTPYSVTGASYTGDNFDVVNETIAPTGIEFNEDGTIMYIVGSNNIYQYTLTVGYDVTTAVYDSVLFDTSNEVGSAYQMLFGPDGVKMYITKETSDNIYQYSTNI